jgi:hypothetical protein
VKQIDIYEVFWILGRLAKSELPETACCLLESGSDSPSLRQLAGLMPDEVDQAGKLFEDALSELGRQRISVATAMYRYIYLISCEIISGATTPKSGADKIWRTVLATQIPEFHDADPFIYALSERQNRPRESEYFDHEIIKEARRWKAARKGLGS